MSTHCPHCGASSHHHTEYEGLLILECPELNHETVLHIDRDGTFTGLRRSFEQPQLETT